MSNSDSKVGRDDLGPAIEQDKLKDLKNEIQNGYDSASRDGGVEWRYGSQKMLPKGDDLKSWERSLAHNSGYRSEGLNYEGSRKRIYSCTKNNGATAQAQFAVILFFFTSQLSTGILRIPQG